MITIKEMPYKNFGKCLMITNGIIEILTTVDVGPRIIKCNLTGKHNLMFNDIERKVTHDVSELYGEDKAWYIYGGHRIWLSPEKFPDTYYPDNDKVVYATTATGAVFKPLRQTNTDLQCELKIEMSPDEPTATITHTITNCGKKDVTGSVWCLSVMDKDGTAIVPMPQEDTGLLSNRSIVLWPYTKMSDSRAVWGDKYIALRQNSEAKDAFKVGLNNTAHVAAYINKGQAFIKDFDVNHPNGNYPDRGCSCELYTAEYFLECESISEIKTLKRGESMTHTERWRLCEFDDNFELNESNINDAAAKLGI
ncbi:MAG: hypothetical protein MJ101_04955 [Clostridia bacterium]|nr:hypothetical protein [Clostridia bacterium]